MAPATIRVIEERGEFSALENEWRELLQASSSNNPFLTWEWLNAWWSHFGRPGLLRVIVVRSGKTPIALAPLRLVRSPLPWCSRLEFLGTGEAGSDYLDVIVRRGNEAEALPALAAFLASQRLSLRLTRLPAGSYAAQIARQLSQHGWVSSASDDGVCPVVTLAHHTFDSFLGSLGASHRANVRRRLRALEQQFAVTFERIADHRERRSMLEALASFHVRRYEPRGGSTAFSTSAARSFHEDATRDALDQGWLRMYALRLNGRIAAVMYGFNYGGRFYFYQHGHDEQYSSLSVGLVLMALTLREAIAEGVFEFDLLWGTEPYKSLWARDARPLQRVDLFPVRVGEIVHRRAAEARRAAAHVARRVLAIGSAGAARDT
jgi:CelD/BcsL family acetyltransferase involved in cellulose biosynthesis